MKKLRTALLVAVLSLGVTTVSAAQEPQAQPQGRGGRGMNMQALLTGITLTADQQVKVDSIVKKYQAERETLRAEAQAGGDRQAMMTKMRELMTKQTDEVQAVLTDEQKKTFQKNLDEVRSRQQQQRPPVR